MPLKSISSISKRIFSGGTPSTTNNLFWDGSFAWLSSGETSNRYIYSTEKTITQEGIDNSSTKLAKAGTIVIASAGQGHTRGQTSMLKIDTYINQSIIAIEIDATIANPLYVFYNLSDRYDELRSISDGTSSRGSLTTKLIGDIELDLPEINTQNEIVRIIASIDEKIRNNSRINDNLVNLINFCFEKISSNSTDSVKLGKIADVQTGPFGSQLHQEDYVTDGTPLVSVENLGEFHLNRKHLPRVSSEDCARLTRYIMDEGDIIFSRVGYVDRSSYVSRMENGWMFSGSCLRIRNNDPIYALYTYFYLNTRDSKETFRNIAIGATRPSINSSILLDFEIKLPSKSEMEQFNKIAKKIELVMTNNALKIEKLMMMRDCLLPKLLSGEIDVSNLSIAQLNNHLSVLLVLFTYCFINILRFMVNDRRDYF